MRTGRNRVRQPVLRVSSLDHWDMRTGRNREYLAAQAAVSEVTAKIRMRFRPWMTAEDRVIHEGTIYNIVSVIDVRSENRELVLMCKAVG